MKFRVSPLWFSIVVFLALLQVGVTAAIAYFLAADFIAQNLLLVVGILAVEAIVALDLFVMYWLIQATQRWEPSEEEH